MGHMSVRIRAEKRFTRRYARNQMATCQRTNGRQGHAQTKCAHACVRMQKLPVLRSMLLLPCLKTPQKEPNVNNQAAAAMCPACHAMAPAVFQKGSGMAEAVQGKGHGIKRSFSFLFLLTHAPRPNCPREGGGNTGGEKGFIRNPFTWRGRGREGGERERVDSSRQRRRRRWWGQGV